MKKQEFFSYSFTYIILFLFIRKELFFAPSVNYFRIFGFVFLGVAALIAGVRIINEGKLRLYTRDFKIKSKIARVIWGIIFILFSLGIMFLANI